jgi:hypothetical protein
VGPWYGIEAKIHSLPYPPETVCVMDNCRIHKGLDDVFAAKGYIPMFLSPYSPQFGRTCILKNEESLPFPVAVA